MNDCDHCGHEFKRYIEGGDLELPLMVPADAPIQGYYHYGLYAVTLCRNCYAYLNEGFPWQSNGRLLKYDGSEL